MEKCHDVANAAQRKVNKQGDLDFRLGISVVKHKGSLPTFSSRGDAAEEKHCRILGSCNLTKLRRETM